MSSELSRWVVLRFGPSGLSEPERWRSLAEVIRRRRREGLRPLVVLPALPGMPEHMWKMLGLPGGGPPRLKVLSVTDPHLDLALRLGFSRADAESMLAPDLLDLGQVALQHAVTRRDDAPTQARITSFAERLLTRIAVAYLNREGIPAGWHDARTSVIVPRKPGRTPGSQLLPGEALLKHLRALPDVVVTQGGIAKDSKDRTVRLEPGGADLSAAAFSVWLEAERCEVWTDVPGLFTVDPSLVPSARLLRAVDYAEAQEIVTSGAAVLHPRAIPPLRRHRIPLHLRWIDHPESPGTVVSAAGKDAGPQVKAISVRNGITLIAMETVEMWREAGFLAETFNLFARQGLSIDAVATSETNITVSLDPGASNSEANGSGRERLDKLDKLMTDLQAVCEPQRIAPAAALTLVGRGIRTVLHELIPVLEAFEEMKVHLMTQAANDLNLTFIVDEEQSERLLRQLHGLLFSHHSESAVFGPTWAEMVQGDKADPVAASGEGDWWRDRRDDLLALATQESPLYVYDSATLDRTARSVRDLGVFDRVFYAIKANSHAGVLSRFEAQGLGFECVSAPELEHVVRLFPDLDPARLLFTPNFAPPAEFRRAFEIGARVTIDSLHPLRAWPDLFRSREVLVRLDPGHGQGHHAYVRTAGAQSKFGVAPENLAELSDLAYRAGVRIVGLHAHAGSGIRWAGSWSETARFLAGLAEQAERLFPDVRSLDLGGGLGIPERTGEAPLDLGELAASLRSFREEHPRFELWIEPGRFLAARSGVLLARVVQLKRKGGVTWIGVETGMNSLIRPALYGAYHPIVNLTRLHEPATMLAHVVGPICETGDILGRSRLLAPVEEGDVLLLANCGAYGRVMSSWYNLREPAKEILLPETL